MNSRFGSLIVQQQFSNGGGSSKQPGSDCVDENEHAAKDHVEEEVEDKLPLGVYLKWVKTELENEQACLELPFTIILLLSFSALAYLHLKQASVFNVEGAVEFDIMENANFAWSHNFGHKTIFDVNSIPDFWSWLRIGYLPLVVQHAWGYSESLAQAYDAVAPAVDASVAYDAAQLPGHWTIPGLGPDKTPARDDYLHHNRIIGGIRLRQERSRIGWDHCRLPGGIPEDIWKDWLGKPCVPADPSYELTPEVSEAEMFGEPKRVEWLLTKIDTLNQLQRKVVDMEDGCAALYVKGSDTCLCTTCNEDAKKNGPWLDEQTQRVEVAFVMFNFEYGLYSLVSANFFFNRGGRISKLVHVQSSWASQFSGSFWYVAVMIACDLVWVLSLTYILFGELKEIVHVIHTTKERWYKAVWNDYVAFWNTVDWISILAAFSVVVCFIRLFICTSDVNQAFEGIAALDVATVTRASYTESLEDFMDLVELMCSFEREYRIAFTIYPMAVMLRLFKSFDAQPRLAVVTRTLVKSQKDMVHFFIVFFSCFFCMVVNAVLLFGQDVENFSTLDRAVMTLFRMLFGDWDYKQMELVGLLNCASWFWAFILILFLILLNILLAILMESYADVKAHAVNQTTLKDQISEMVRRYRQTQKKARVRLNEVWKAFFKQIGDEKDMIVSEPSPGFPAGTGGREVVTPTMLQDRVYRLMRLNMPLSQAKRGLKTAREEQEGMDTSHQFGTEEVYQQFSRFQLLVRDVRESVRDIVDLMQQHDCEDIDNPTLQASIPDTPRQEEDDKRRDVAGAVHNVISELSVEIQSTLTKECSGFEHRHKELEQTQTEMLFCAKDAFTTLSRLRAKTDIVVQSLQRQALQKQREEVEGGDASAGLAAVLTSCGIQAATAFPSCGAPTRGRLESD